MYVVCHSGNEKVAVLQRVAGLSCSVYGGNFIKDLMGVWQGNELLADLQRFIQTFEILFSKFLNTLDFTKLKIKSKS